MQFEVRDERIKGHFWDKNEIFDMGLSKHALLVRFFLARCADNSGKCFPSLNTIANKCDLGRATVARALNELEETGLISRKTRPKAGTKANDTTIYTLFVPKIVQEVVSERDGGSLQQRLGLSQGETRVVSGRDGEQDSLNKTQLTIALEDISEAEQKALGVLKRIDGYPFDEKTDLDFIRKWSAKYEGVNVLSVIEDYEDWRSGKKYKPNESPRGQINTFLKKEKAKLVAQQPTPQPSSYQPKYTDLSRYED